MSNENWDFELQALSDTGASDGDCGCMEEAPVLGADDLGSMEAAPFELEMLAGDALGGFEDFGAADGFEELEGLGASDEFGAVEDFGAADGFDEFAEFAEFEATEFGDELDPLALDEGDFDLAEGMEDDLGEEFDFEAALADEGPSGGATLEDVLALARQYPGLRITFGF